MCKNNWDFPSSSGRNVMYNICDASYTALTFNSKAAIPIPVAAPDPAKPMK